MTRLRLIGLAALAAVAVAWGVFPAPAGAASAATLTITRIDGSNLPHITLDVAVTGTTPTASAFSVEDNGRRASDVAVTAIAGSTIPVNLVYLVDTSNAMNDDGRLAVEQSGLDALIAAKPGNVKAALVAYGGTPVIMEGLTGDSGALTTAVSHLGVGGSAELYAGVRTATNLLNPVSAGVTELVVVGGAANSGGVGTYATATGDVSGSGASTYGIGLDYGPLTTPDLDGIQGVAAAGNGTYQNVTTAAAVPAAFTAVGSALRNQFQIAYTSSSSSSTPNVTVSVDGVSATGQVFEGVAVGQAANPPAVTRPQAPGPLRGKSGLLFIGLIVLVGAGLFAYAVLLLVADEDSHLVSVLRPYAGHGSDGEPADAESSLIQTALLQRAVDSTAKFAQDRGFLEVIETKLEQANLKLRPAEALFVYVVGAVLLTLATFVLLGPLVGLGVALVAVLVPPAALNFLADRRLKKFNSQLPDTLQLLASSLRAGFSFLQGVDAVAKEVDEPMGAELRRVLAEAKLGRPVEAALEECANRLKSPDFQWAVMAVGIQREVGGNLAELLQTVSETMVERERLRRDVKSLTAEGRMSAIVLGVLPPGMGIMFYVLNPSYIRILFQNTGGVIASVVAVIAMVLGFAWMKKIVTIDV